MIAGFGFGFVNFKSWSMRRFTSFFGLGLGIGMNYMQIKRLWVISSGDQSKINKL